jgi:hypothetical protein
MNFAELLAAANESKTGRGPRQWTPAACRVWREAEPEASRLLEAALAWELAAGRTATADDEPALCERRRMMDEATAAKAGTCIYGTHRDDQDVDQPMIDLARASWILKR